MEEKELSPEQLAEQCRAGCRESFETLVQQFAPRIFNYLFQLVHHREEAEDLTQETFLKAYHSISRYDSHFSFATWLFTIAKRSAYSYWRSARRREEMEGRDEIDERDPSVLLQENDAKVSLWDLAKKLKPKQYEVLWLRYGEGFSIPEVARVTGQSSIYVKVLLHRARTQLAKSLRSRDVMESRNLLRVL